MKTKILNDRQLCVITSQKELPFSTFSCKDQISRKNLRDIYKKTAEKFGFSTSPHRLSVELFPFINNGCMIIYTLRKKRYKKISPVFFCTVWNPRQSARLQTKNQAFAKIYPLYRAFCKRHRLFCKNSRKI